MVKKRKSIRKAPTVILIEGEEQAFETAPDTDPDAPQDANMSDADADPKDSAQDGNEADEGSAWLAMSEKDRERALEEWLTFKEEHHEIIEQLPLSLYRSMSLLRELDDQVHEYNDALEPAIRSYVALRMKLAGRPWPPPPEASSEPAIQIPTSGVSQEGMDLEKVVISGSPETVPEPVSATPLLTELQIPNKSHAAEGFDEEPSKAMPQAPPSLPDPNLSLLLDDPPGPAQRVPHLRPPNPFALQRSHSSFALLAKKIKQEPPQSTRDMLARISWLSSQAVRASEEKLGIASAAYNSVDRHVRGLDAAIKEHEASLLLGLRQGTRPTTGVLSNGDAEIFAAASDDADDDDELTIGMEGGDKRSKRLMTDKERKNMKERERRARVRKKQRREADGAPVAGPDMTKLGMPIDPHEPRYCYCHQVSYGEMIGCDNENCANEWFHLPCVGLTEAPKAEKKWYCRDCAPMFEKASRKKR